MKNKFLKTMAMAMAGVALLAHPAKASTFTVGNGDLVLGVEATGSGNGVSASGATQDYMADLGNFSQFLPTATINFGTLGTVSASDINSIFSSNTGANSAFTSNNLEFGVVGVSGADHAAVNGGAPNGINQTFINTFFATQTSDSGPLLNGQVGTSASNISQLENTYTRYTMAGAEISTSNVNSFTYNETDGGNNPGFFQTPSPGEVTLGSGSTLSLYEFSPTGDPRVPSGSTGTEELLGSFSFTNGDLVFNGAAVTAPEPSTYALCLGSIALLWVLARRRALLN